MKTFISYCENNGGLDLAKKASVILKRYRHKSWYFERDKTPGALRIVDICHHVTEWCDVLLYICTSGSMNSDGQIKEVAYADDVRKAMIVLPMDNATVRPEIRIYIHTKINSSDFEQEFESVAKNLPAIINKSKRLDSKIKAQERKDL